MASRTTGSSPINGRQTKREKGGGGGGGTTMTTTAKKGGCAATILRMSTKLWMVLILMFSIILLIRQNIKLNQTYDEIIESGLSGISGSPAGSASSSLAMNPRLAQLAQFKQLSKKNQRNKMKKKQPEQSRGKDVSVERQDQEKMNKTHLSTNNKYEKYNTKDEGQSKKHKKDMIQGGDNINNILDVDNDIDDDDDVISNNVNDNTNNENDNGNDSSDCKDFDHRALFPNHGCEYNNATAIVYCSIQQLRIDTNKIKCSMGGEPLLLSSSSTATSTTSSTKKNSKNDDGENNLQWNPEVMGRAEAIEFPVYKTGAFATTKVPAFPTEQLKGVNLHYLRDVFIAMTTIQNISTSPTMAMINNNSTNDIVPPLPKEECAITIPGTTMFITRYEYANLYHTMTDWWNAFSVYPKSSRKERNRIRRRQQRQQQQRRTNDDENNEINNVKAKYINETRVIFLDGHAQGHLDDIWGTLFGPYTYVKQLPSLLAAYVANATSPGPNDRDTNGGICFERAIFIPPGYMSRLFPKYFVSAGLKNCPNSTMATKFRNFFLQSFSSSASTTSASTTSSALSLSSNPISTINMEKNDITATAAGTTTNNNDVIDLKNQQPDKGKIVIIDRQPYISHPRISGVGIKDKYKDKPPPKPKLGRVITNLSKLKEEIFNQLGDGTVTSIDIVQLDKLSSFTEQLRIIRSARIVIGMHGAGLTHIMFMDPNHSAMIEYYAPGSGGAGLKFFNALHKWTTVPHYKFSLQNIVNDRPTTLTSKDIQKTIDTIKSIYAGKGNKKKKKQQMKKIK